MSTLANDFSSGVLNGAEPPCLSLYQPTFRQHPRNQQDRIRFRNLVKQMEGSLRQKYPRSDVLHLTKQYHALVDDSRFWNHAFDGLAVLGACDVFRVYKLQRPVSELVIVADSFHTKPLLRILQSAGRYQVLALNRREIKLFEGNRDALDEIELPPGIPRTIDEALGSEHTEPHLTVASYGGIGGPGMRHGHGGRKDEVKGDTERFFRAVDRAVIKHSSRPSGLPLILAALPEYHTVFRRVSHNAFLVSDGVTVHPDALMVGEFRERAWRVVEPGYRARLAGLTEEFGHATSKGLGSDDVAVVAEAAAAGRVEKLLIEADRQVPGRMDAKTGRIELSDLSHPEVDDILDDLAEIVLRMKGTVVVVPGERMPTTTGVAATFRY